MEQLGLRRVESEVNRTMDLERNAMGVKRRLAILSMATCVALSGVVAGSGCGVRMGMEKIDDAKQAKKQAEKQRHELEEKLQEGQKNLEGQ